MKTINIDIRPAAPRDAEAISEVHRDAWMGAYAGIIPHKALTAMINRRGPKWWTKALRNSNLVIVVEIEGDIVGYATLGPSRAHQLKPEGEIYELYMLPEYQGVGLGSRLFNAAKRRLAQLGLRGMVVWALEDNDNALGFYEGAGGREVAEGVEVFDQKALRKIAYAWN